MNIALTEAVAAVKSQAPDLFGVRFEKTCEGQPEVISFQTFAELLLRTASPDERFGVHGEQTIFGIEVKGPGGRQWFEPGADDLPPLLAQAIPGWFGDAVVLPILRALGAEPASPIRTDFVAVATGEGVYAPHLALSWDGGTATAWYHDAAPPTMFACRVDTLGGTALKSIGEALARSWPGAATACTGAVH